MEDKNASKLQPQQPLGRAWLLLLLYKLRSSCQILTVRR